MRWGPLVVLAVLVAVLLGAGHAAFGSDFIYFSTDLGTVPYDQALTVLAFEGLVNRDQARLYVNTRTLHPWYAEGGAYYWGNESDPRWLEIYGQRGYTYGPVTSVADLLGRQEFRSFVSGLVIYDPDELPAATWIAMTIAGMENRLPVTSAVLTAIPQLTTWWPDTVDLRSSLTGKLSAYQWAIGQYLAQTSQSVAYVIGHDFEGGDAGDFMALDYAVAKRAFVFDLSLDAASHPSEVALADVIMAHLTPPAALWGWYSEMEFCDFASQRGDYAINGVLASNMSFHRQIPPASVEPLHQTSRSDLSELTLDPNTYYLATVFTDGDIPSRLTRFFEASNWFDPARGQVPMNWGIDPALAQEFPALFEYFYTNATSNDYFVAGPSSAGYTHPSIMPNLPAYAAFVADCDAVVDVDIAVIWDYSLDSAVYDPFLDASGLQAVIHSAAPGGLSFRGSHVPVFAQTFFWRWWDSRVPPEQIASDVAAELSQGPPPAFATFWDGQMQRPGIAKKVMDILAPQGYQFLRLDEMNALARQIDHFYDVGTKYWAHDEVEACYDAGIVQGYSETHFVPTLSVTRDQMAVFLVRALGQEPSGPVTPQAWKDAYGYDPAEPSTWAVDFTDVPASGWGSPAGPYWAWFHIQRLYEIGVTQGVTATEYGPAQEVRRDQMAVFLIRALGQECANPCADTTCWAYDPANPATWAHDFADIPATGQDTCHDAHWAWYHIQALYETGVTLGCGDGTNYCPGDSVRRDEMAVFLARAFLGM